jgi:hypothetical protein
MVRNEKKREEKGRKGKKREEKAGNGVGKNTHTSSER